MNGFGEQTVAAITTAYRVDTVIILPIVNFGSGIATVVAQNIGAGNQERAKKVLKAGMVMISIVSLCLTGLVLAAGGYLIAMFGLTQESVEIGKSFFRAIASCYIVYGLAMAVRGYLEGTGDMLFFRNSRYCFFRS
ncbi:MatE protein [Eubacterium aggregans]|uniref:Probable multidrug resistance protein NorM n=1 Tax=Eubacterium aggregans TaxID=81409 RepID=A0A1H4EKF6_9FIRM|nr:MATE family efflux transporter [Eubacterium aggregans]SEA85515.1 MatE protein [Eubacterium aggregans]